MAVAAMAIEMVMANDRRTANNDGGEKHLGKRPVEWWVERGESEPTDWTLEGK
jgi:hypothetical protein